MTAHAINRPAALVMLLGLLAGLAGIMLGGFSLAQRLQEQVAADTTRLATLRAQIQRLSAVPLQREATKAHDNVDRFLLPASAPGTASARLQSRLITLTAEAGGRVASARVLAPVTQGDLIRISVDLAVEIKIAGLRDLLLAIETDVPVAVIHRLNVRRINDPATTPSASGPRQDPLLDVRLRISGYLAANADQGKP